MKLSFDNELEELREEFRRPLAGVTLASTLDWLRTHSPLDRALWSRLAELGWLATAIPSDHGGSGVGELMLCLQAEEIGRSLTPIPFVASVCGYGVGVLAAADADARAELLPAAADGSAIGVLLTMDCWRDAPRLTMSGSQARIDGTAQFVPDGVGATAALACVSTDDGAAIVHLDLECAERLVAADPLDLLHPCATFNFDASAAKVLLRGATAESVWRDILDRYALFTAFEQTGAAVAALEIARQYALQRYAFGRPIGSFQALKHTFADLFAAVDLARSNCLFGAAALNSAPGALREAVCVARISATDAFRRCARGLMHLHGAQGVTWDAGFHLYYRRAQALAGHPGALDDWKESLVQTLLAKVGDPGVAH